MSHYPITIVPAPTEYGTDQPRHLLTIGGRTFLTGDLCSTMNQAIAYPVWVGLPGAPPEVTERVDA